MARGHNELGIKGFNVATAMGPYAPAENIPEGSLCRPTVAKVMREPVIAARITA
jgi:hypothetical protein